MAEVRFGRKALAEVAAIHAWLSERNPAAATPSPPQSREPPSSTTGDGPIYRKHGRYVRYHIDDVNAWSEARCKTSTSHA